MSAFTDSIPFYMTHETSVDLLEKSQDRRAKYLKQQAVRDELAKQVLARALADKNLRTGTDRRVEGSSPGFHSVQDMLNFQDRRVSERRARGDTTPIYSPDSFEDRIAHARLLDRA